MEGEPSDDEPTSGVTVVRHRRAWPLRVLMWLLGLVLVLVVLAGLLVVGLNSDPGRRIVAQRVAGLHFENGMKIGIGRIDGSLYGRMTVHDLTLSDPKGVFFVAPLVNVDWRPFQYVHSHIDIRSLVAPTATFARKPEFKVTPPSDAPLLPDYDIDVGRFRVDRLLVGPAVAGTQRTGSMEGSAHIADRRAQIALKAAVLPGPGAQGGDRLELKLDAVPERNRLALTLAVDAPGSGVLARLARLKTPVALRVNGRGDWNNWNGQLAANLDGAPFARLALTARNGTFGVRGPTRLSRLVEGPTAALLGPVTNLDLTTTWQNRLAEVSARIGSKAFTLVGTGRADLGRNRFDGLKLSFGLLKPSAIAPNLAGRDVRVSGTVNGAFASPRVDYAVTAATLQFNDMGLQNFRASGVAQVGKDHSTVPIAARAGRITGLDLAAGGQLSNVRLDGDLAIDWPRIVSDNVRIRSDRIDAKAIILADISKGLYSGAVEGRVNNYRIDSVGIFNINTHADVKTLAQGGFDLVGRVRAQSTKLFNDGVRNFLGGNLIASSDLLYGRDGVIRFSHLRLAAPLLRVTDGGGSYAPTGQIELRAAGQSKQYGPVSLQLSGTVSDPHVQILAARPGFGLGIAGLRADIRPVGKAYRVLASGNTDYGPFTADVLVNPAAGPLDINITRASIAGIGVRGHLRQSPTGPYTGQLAASGEGLGGLVRLSAAGKYQQALINIRANNIVLPGPARLAVGAAIIDGRAILYDQPEIVADAQIAQTRFQGYDINAARAMIDYRGGRGFARVLAEGSASVPFRIALNSELQPNLWRAAIEGRVRGVDFHTASPLRIIPRRGGYDLLPAAIQFDRGSVRLAGSYGPGIRLQARLDQLDMALIDSVSPGLGVNGAATGSVDFEQASSGALPRADVRLAIRNFTRTSAATVSQPVDINLVSQLQPGRGEMRAVMRTRGTVIGRFQAFLTPLGPTAGGWTQRISQAPVTGGLRYIGPADTLFSFAGLPDQRLSGPIGVAADFTCRVSQPCLQGIVRGRSLTYDNLTYGTRLSNMAISGRFTGERLEIDQLAAQAGSGSVAGKGYVSLAAASGYPANFDLKLDNARLANSEGLRATATGNVRLVKTANARPVLTGTVVLPATRYGIVRQSAAGVTELTGVRFKPPRDRPRVTGDAPPPTNAGFADVGLDLRITAPGQLFVSGMGLESEWRADVAVSGTNQAPGVAGQFELVRGTLGFAGRSFELQEGRVSFNGGPATDARITLSATETIEDVAVTINVTGSATNPQIAFSSTPGLPQDEIVSRILFGSSVGNLSAIQAVQLAASLNTLRGSGGGGLNPLGKLRAIAGIDRLRILGPDDASGRGSALAAGKYISKNIYLEVVTDARGFTATQLEVTLSRALSILSHAGGSNATNVSARYRKNY